MGYMVRPASWCGPHPLIQVAGLSTSFSAPRVEGQLERWVVVGLKARILVADDA